MLKNFIPPILLYSNWVDRYFRYKIKKIISKKISYEKNFFNRIAFIIRAINKFKITPMYLEIGCDQNEVFNSIPIIPSNKIGVDPRSGGTHRMTSDDFFRQNDKNFDDFYDKYLDQLPIINSLEAFKFIDGN
jgi:hypothetical protein